jgi:hypothetical protein
VSDDDDGQPRARQTSAFVDRWAKAALLAPVLAFVLFIVDSTAHSTIWSGSFSLAEDEESTTPVLTLPTSWIGGVRIEAHAQLPTNRWAAFQITVQEPDGTVLLELVKEAWAESGVWHEDGESGTWDEDDQELVWDLRSRKAEQVKVIVSVLDQGFSSDDPSASAPSDDGEDAHFYFPIRLAVYSGVVDGRFIALAFLFSLAFSVLAYYVAGVSGVPVIVEMNDDSEVKGRAQMGGPGRLVAVSVAGLVDETAPPEMRVTVILRDEDGADHYRCTDVVKVSFRTDEGEVEDGRFSLRLYFELPRRTSWGLFVEAAPDGPMENLKLVVRDGATTRAPIAVEVLQEAAS